MVVPVTVSSAPAISPTPSVRLTLETFTVVVLYSSTITTVLVSSESTVLPLETILTMAFVPSEFIVTVNLMGLEGRYPLGALVSVSVYVPFLSLSFSGVPSDIHVIGWNDCPSEVTSFSAVNFSVAPLISLPPTSRLEMSTSPEVGVCVFVTV